MAIGDDGSTVSRQLARQLARQLERRRAMTAAAEYTRAAGALLDQLGADAHAAQSFMRQDPWAEPGQLDETWRAGILAALHQWRDRARQLQDLPSPNAFTTGVHVRLQRCGGELIAAITAFEAAVTTVDGEQWHVGRERLARAGDLVGDAERSVRRLVERFDLSME